MVYDLFRAVGLAPVCDLVRGVTRAVTTSVAGSKAGRQVNRTIDNALGDPPSITGTRQIQVQLAVAQVQTALQPSPQPPPAPTSKGTPWYRVDHHLGGVAETAVGLAGNVTGRVVGCAFQGFVRGLRFQGNKGCDSGEQAKAYEQTARSMVQCSLLECARDALIGAVTGGTATIAYKAAETYRKARKAQKAGKGGSTGGAGGWKRGDDIWAPTSAGSPPTWTTVRSRYLKNAASQPDAAKRYGQAMSSV